MFKKITLTIVVLIMAIVNIRGQANWTFVGPRSNNNASGTEFETSQMSKVLTIPGSPNIVFATSAYGGLWMSTNSGDNWNNVDMSSTGLDQAYALSVKNSNEVLIGNYHTDDNGGYSTRVSSYNFNNNTWFHYPTFFTKLTVNCIVSHPNPSFSNVIYAGTSIGLFRYNGINWVHVLGNCYIESIVFADNGTCFISGSDVSCPYGTACFYSGKSLVYVSTDLGNSNFQNFSQNVIDWLQTWDLSHTAICYGGPGVVYAVSSAFYHADQLNPEHRKYYRITKTGPSTFVTQYLNESVYTYIPWRGRIAIAYDAVNNNLFSASVNLAKVNLNITGNPVTEFSRSSRMTLGALHDDQHGLHIDENNNLWVASDGGIAMSPLATISSSSFNRKNNNLNVSLLYGFSGSEQDPKLYVCGGQDICNTDIYYDNPPYNNLRTIQDGENDGGTIYKFDDNYMFMDNYTNDNITLISNDKGLNNTPSFPYWPEPTAPFRSKNPPNNLDINSQRGPMQRTVQDPFRQGRVFQIGRMMCPGFYQYSFEENKMIYKVGFSSSQDIWPQNTKVNCSQHLQDLSFFPRHKNSVYIITALPGSAIIKYIGPNIDDCWSGHYETRDVNNNPQWQEVTPPYETFQSVLGAGYANITSQNDLNKIWLKKVEISSVDQKIIYVAGTFDVVSPNNAIKVLKYDGINWTDYSYGIPADAIVGTMVMDHYSKDALYLGTDKGVYYRDASMTYWEPYSTGLPSIQITQMEINYKENTLRVSTFGRGIWKSNLKCPPASLDYSQWYNYGFSPSGVYEATNITSSWEHQTAAGPNILRATNSVVLNPGFKATPTGNNTFFLALIHGCNPSNGTSPSMYRSSELPFSNAINEESDKDPSVLVYPNPTQDKFTISLNPNDELPQSISVRSVLGNEVKKINSVTERNLTIDLSDCSDGVYIVNVNYADKTLTNKIVKTSGR